METYNYNDYKTVICKLYRTDNESSSKKGVLRGLQFARLIIRRMTGAVLKR